MPPLPPHPSFAITGNYGEGNLGDEALLLSCISLLRQRWPACPIHVFSNDPPQTARAYNVESSRNLGLLKLKNLAVMARRGELSALLRTLRHADCLIAGGGELLRTDYGAWAVLTVFDRVLLAQFLRRPVLMLGVGAGQLSGRGLPFRLLRAGCRRATILTRDPESARTLAAAGLPGAGHAPDLAFLLPPQPPAQDLPPGPKIAFSFLNPSAARTRALDWMDTRRIVQAGAALLLEAARLGATPVLTAFNHGPRDDDRAIHRSIADAAGPAARPLLIDEVTDPARMQSILAACGLTAGMRLHACVLSLAASVPALAVAYDPKVRKVMETMDQGDAVLPLDEIESAPARLRALWDQRHRRGPAIQAAVEAGRTRFHDAFDLALRKALPAWT